MGCDRSRWAGKDGREHLVCDNRSRFRLRDQADNGSRGGPKPRWPDDLRAS